MRGVERDGDKISGDGFTPGSEIGVEVKSSRSGYLTFLFELIIAFDEGYDDQLRCFEDEFFERREQQPDLFDNIEVDFEEFEDEIPF
jgi:hypothetical protein